MAKKNKKTNPELDKAREELAKAKEELAELKAKWNEQNELRCQAEEEMKALEPEIARVMRVNWGKAAPGAKPPSIVLGTTEKVACQKRDKEDGSPGDYYLRDVKSFEPLDL